jgi:TonB family protein
MRTPISTKQRSFPIGSQVCAAALTAFFTFAPHMLMTSMAQSEDTKGKKPAPTPTSAVEGATASLKPKIIYREKAKYTKEGRDNLTHGTVELSVVFRADGSISDFKVVNGLPDGLTEKAIEAAKKIRFEPAIKGGQPVSVRATLEFTFHLYELGEKEISKIMHNDFPMLSKETVQEMATVIYKRGDRDTRKAWLFTQQCLENGMSKLPQSGQEELTSLTLEAVRGLNESDQRSYQQFMEKSKTERLPDDVEIRMMEIRLRGISRLPDEKRRRVSALYNNAVTLGTKLP